ncbi:hypothetical protein GGR20_003691 [Devosia subaequoris]|uniref:Uncharacterized protein n=1 Tax=Devosia subaequoris TaxID=395930 RepID=A0A7W6IQW9_9HYPH|nr:hypothetical protein [Devosia subaequoris]
MAKTLERRKSTDLLRPRFSFSLYFASWRVLASKDPKRECPQIHYSRPERSVGKNLDIVV